MTTKAQIIKEIIDIICSEQEPIEISDPVEFGLTADNYYSVAEKIQSFIQSITDAENQPNQYGIKV